MQLQNPPSQTGSGSFVRSYHTACVRVSLAHASLSRKQVLALRFWLFSDDSYPGREHPRATIDTGWHLIVGTSLHTYKLYYRLLKLKTEKRALASKFEHHCSFFKTLVTGRVLHGKRARLLWLATTSVEKSWNPLSIAWRNMLLIEFRIPPASWHYQFGR